MRTMCLVLLVGSLPVLAQEAPAPRPVLNGLSLKAYSVSIEANEETATAVVEQTFFNHGAGMREADYVFPLPPGTPPTGLELKMGDRFYGGNLLRSTEARRIYERITRRSRDPAILDCIGKDLYRCRVFPVPAHGDAEVRFSYRQPLLAEGAMRRLVVPLDAARFNRSPVDTFHLKIDVRTDSALQAIVCPTHEVDIERLSARHAIVRLKARQAYLTHDLELLYSVEDAPIGVVAGSYRHPGERGYFVLSLDAAFAQEAQLTAPRDIVLAIDTSNSAGRDGIDASAAAVAEAVKALKPDDRLALVAFSTTAETIADWRPVSDVTGDDIRAAFAERPALGRTDLSLALRESARVAATGKPGAGIVLLTDGIATESAPGFTDARAIAKSGHRVGFCAAGQGVDTTALEELGREGEGDSAFPDPGGMVLGVRRVFDSTRQVPLTDVRVSIDGVSDLEPETFRMVCAGETILVAGRYARAGDAEVTVRGLVAGTPVERTMRIHLRESGGEPAVARMWAARRVGALLEEALRAGDPEMHAREIGRLGRRFGIVTPHTSLLVLEEDDQNRFLGGMRRRPLLQSAGGTVAGRAYTQAQVSADLIERIRKLRRCNSGGADPFVDLLGKNRMRVRFAAGHTFYRQDDGVWVEDTFVDARPAEVTEIAFLSDAWFALLDDADIAAILALGDSVVFRRADGTAVQVVE